MTTPNNHSLTGIMFLIACANSSCWPLTPSCLAIVCSSNFCCSFIWIVCNNFCLVSADAVLIWAGTVAIGTGLSGLTKFAGGATGMVASPPRESSELLGDPTHTQLDWTLLHITNIYHCMPDLEVPAPIHPLCHTLVSLSVCWQQECALSRELTHAYYWHHPLQVTESNSVRRWAIWWAWTSRVLQR